MNDDQREGTAFGVPAEYRELLQFAAGRVGWFVPVAVRAQAQKALKELVHLRAVRDLPRRVEERDREG